MSTRQKLENTAYVPKQWETVSCPVCGSTDKSLYERFGDQWQYSYVLCNTCQMVYLSPRPKYDDEFIHDAYEFYADEDWRYPADVQKFLESTRPDHDQELSEIKKFDQATTALLDVGCATGNFLYAAKQHYPDVYGLEVSKRMAATVEKTLGVTVFTTPFENLDTSVKFSCITMSHVIEHIPDPHQWLQKAKTLLDKDGILMINVPNMFSLNRKFKLMLKHLGLRKGKWEPWRTPDHLYEPTIPSMLRLFDMNGYEVLDYYTYSRKDIIARSTWGKLYNRILRKGSNLRFYVRPRPT